MGCSFSLSLTEFGSKSGNCSITKENLPPITNDLQLQPLAGIRPVFFGCLLGEKSLRLPSKGTQSDTACVKQILLHLVQTSTCHNNLNQ